MRPEGALEAMMIDSGWAVPICPVCEEEVTDSPREDIPTPCTEYEIECAQCGWPVFVTAVVRVTYYCQLYPTEE